MHFPIYDRLHDEEVTAQIRPMTFADALFWDREIRPALGPDDEDQHWLWSSKYPIDRLTFDDETQGFTLVTVDENGAETVQGLMLVKTTGHKARLVQSGDKRGEIVYIDYLATAPWNRPERSGGTVMRQGRFRGVGMALVSQALLLSEAENKTTGVIGLQSLPGAQGFYKRIGMIEVAQKSTGLRYFELPPTTGQEMISAIKEEVARVE